MRFTPKLALLLLLAAALGCAHLRPERQILAAVEELMGTPYAAGGTDGFGLDCSGLVWAAYQRVGYDLPRSVAGQMGGGRPVAREELRPGDVVFFGGSGPTHCGVYLGGGCFAHASSSQGVTVSDLEGAYWGERFLAGRRYLGD